MVAVYDVQAPACFCEVTGGTARLNDVCIVCGYFGATMVELSTSNKNHRAHKAENLSYLAFQTSAPA